MVYRSNGGKETKFKEPQ